MTIPEKILKVSEALPEAAQVELLDFAEFLYQRHKVENEKASSKGISLATLCGGLEDSETFKGDPVEIQRGLRDEWY